MITLLLPISAVTAKNGEFLLHEISMNQKKFRGKQYHF